MDVQIVYNKTGQRRESGFGITSTLEEAEKAAEMFDSYVSSVLGYFLYIF
jgi:hypothetical protein